MLYLIGLGLGDAKDITVKGLEIVKKVDKVYLENYTSILCCGQVELEKFYERSVILIDREMMEQGCDEILSSAKNGDVAILVVGDPLNATTHTDLLLRAASLEIGHKVIHNASIVNAVACCGLQIYNFGETISIPFWTDTWKPESFYDKIVKNRKNNLHTLCLLDIKIKEPNLEKLMKGIQEYEPARFMSTQQATKQLLDIIKNRTFLQTDNKGGDTFDLKSDSICIGLARIGSDKQKIVKLTLHEASTYDLGDPLHSLVIPATVMHPLELEMIDLFTKATLDKIK